MIRSVEGRSASASLRYVGARALGLAVAWTSLAACAPIPQPRVVVEADRVATAQASLEAKTLAPSAFAHAEKLRLEAHAALEHDRAAHAQIIAEEAIAAYEEASALARVARAQRGEQQALSEADRQGRELAELEAELTRAKADADALEARLKTTRDAEPITPSGPASGAREEARREAARAMAVQAKLLCTSARLLGAPVAAPPAPTQPSKGAAPSGDAAKNGAPPKADASKADASKADAPKVADAPQDPTSPQVLARDLGAAEADLDKLTAALAGTGPTPVDLATRARASCLSVLTRVRRVAADPRKAPGASDALLAELSAYASRQGQAMSPGRDERGVSVSIERPFDGDGLSSGATAKLAELDRVAAAHPDFAVAVLLHSDKPVATSEQARWKTRAEKVASALKSVPRGRLSTLVAGNGSPLVDPRGKDKARNLRLEIVFVSPEPL
jgi:hypothetical protein